MYNNRRHDDLDTSPETGFTLIELAIVILIIGVLLALALPTFLGVRDSAHDKSAQSAVRIAAVNAKAEYSLLQDFSLVNSQTLGLAEPGTTYSSGPSTGFRSVSFVVDPTFQVFEAAALSSTGRCYMVMDDLNTGTPTSGTTLWRSMVAGSASATTVTACEPPLSGATTGFVQIAKTT